MTDPRPLQIFTGIFVLVSCITGFLYCAANPLWNWDVLGYTASAINLYEVDLNTIHQNVYSALKNRVSETVWLELTASTDYRKVMLEDAEAFSQQIPYYKIRVLFILLMLLLAKSGVDILNTAHLLTAFFYSAGTLLYYVSLRNLVHSVFWLMFPVLMYVFTQELDISRHAVVDSFGFLWMALITYAFIRQRNWLPLVVALMVLIRTDLIMLSALIFGVCWIINPAQRKWLVMYGFLTVFLYAAVNHWAGNYGWHTLFYFVFVTDMSATHPENFATYQVSFNEYLKHLINPQWLGKSVYLAYFLFCVNACLFAWLVSRFSKKIQAVAETGNYEEIRHRVFLLSCISGAYVIAHYVLFPLWESRFFVGCYVTICIGTLVLATEVLNRFCSKPPESRPPASRAS